MKTNYVILAALGALALTAVSCINKDWDLNKTDTTTSVPIEQEPVVVPSNDILGYTAENNIVNSDAQGNLHITVEAEGSASVTAALKQGQPTSIPGELEMTADEELPDFCSSESGAVFSNASIILDLNNPSPDPVVFNGTVYAADKNSPLPALTVPAKSNGYKVALVITKGTLTYEDGVKIDEEIQVSGDVADIINHISKETGIVIKNLTVEPVGSKGIAPAAAEYEFSVGATFHAPMWFPAGTVLKYDIDFSGQLLDVSEYNVTVNDYKIEAVVTNTIPFDIDGTGTSTNGVTAKLDQPIKAGDVNQPNKTTVLISIHSTASVMNLEGAVLHITMSTDKDVKINKDQKLDIDMQNIKFSEKK